jgi:hypothetical protein
LNVEKALKILENRNRLVIIRKKFPIRFRYMSKKFGEVLYKDNLENYLKISGQVSNLRERERERERALVLN